MSLELLEAVSRLGVSRTFITSSSKACPTATFTFALVSTNKQPCFLANAAPSALLTSLSDSCSKEKETTHGQMRCYLIIAHATES